MPTQRRDLTHVEGIAVSLEGLAAVAAELKMFDEAALLVGKATLLRGKGGLFRQVLEARFYKATLASLRSHHGSDRLSVILGKGARLDARALDAKIQGIAFEA